MRKAITFIFLVFLISSRVSFASVYTDTEAKGRKVLQFFVDKKFREIENMIDSAYRSSYNALMFERDWTELTGTYGEYVSAKPVHFEQSPYYTFIAFKIKFEYLPYIFNVSLNEKGNVIYISFMPAHKIYVAPDYCDVSKFTERKITPTNGIYEMPGILSTPNDLARSPLIIILVEAGPTDKDGSYEENKPYKDIAWGLATQGFSVFRYEKRSNNYGLYMAKDKAAYEKFTPRDDLLNDLYKIIDTLKTLPDIDSNRIYILGHGQGGMLAPLVAKERADVKGIMMMGANAKQTQLMMVDQYKYLTEVNPSKKAEYDEQTQKAIFSMNKKLNPLTEHDKMPYGVQATYWIWLNQYKHVEITKKLKKPVLIMQGGRDYQTNMENYQMWQKALAKNKNATLKEYPKLNHLFYPGEAQSTYSEYFLKSNIPDYVIQDVLDWLRAY